MKLNHTLTFIEQHNSKRIFTGQRSVEGMTKLYHFAFVLFFTSITFGLWLLLLLLMKKKQFHPDIYVKDSNNSIEADDINKALKKSNYSLIDNEKPLVFIRLKSSQFMLFTDKHVYYTLLASQKITEIQTTSGRLPLKKASEIKLNPTMDYSLTIMIGDEVIGTMSRGEDSRIMGLLKELAKDIRENS